MIDFVNASPFWRIALRVAMATMHILAQIELLLGNIFFALRGSKGTIWHPLKIVLGVQDRLNYIPV